MSDKPREISPATDIDALLQDTWLQVISLRHGPLFKDGEGAQLWQRCAADVKRVQQALRDADVDKPARHHILYAQCALLDETVKGRGVQDDACVEWYNIPLQGHFLGTLDAGDALCDRIRDVLREPAPDLAVLTCFQRVLMLGFLGGYRRIDDPERQRLVKALDEHVRPLSAPFYRPVLAEVKSGRGVNGWFSSWPVRIGFTALLLAALWWGFDHWLDLLLIMQLPGVQK